MYHIDFFLCNYMYAPPSIFDKPQDDPDWVELNEALHVIKLGPDVEVIKQITKLVDEFKVFISAVMYTYY